MDLESDNQMLRRTLTVAARRSAVLILSGFVLLMLLVVVHPLLLRTLWAQVPQGPSAIDAAVYDALGASPEGRVYVIILLDAYFSTQDLEEPARTEVIADQQQSVLDAFEAGEFDLVHRPETVAGLTGRITASGLARV